MFKKLALAVLLACTATITTAGIIQFPTGDGGGGGGGGITSLAADTGGPAIGPAVTLQGGGTVSTARAGNTITITGTGGGGGITELVGDDLNATTGTSVTVSGGNLIDTSVVGSTLTIDSTAASTAANVGGQTGTIWRDTVAGVINLKTLGAGTGIGITNNANDIQITNTLPSLMADTGTGYLAPITNDRGLSVKTGTDVGGNSAFFVTHLGVATFKETAGAGSHEGSILRPTGLSANRTYTLPDKSGELQIAEPRTWEWSIWDNSGVALTDRCTSPIYSDGTTGGSNLIEAAKCDAVGLDGNNVLGKESYLIPANRQIVLTGMTAQVHRLTGLATDSICEFYIYTGTYNVSGASQAASGVLKLDDDCAGAGVTAATQATSCRVTFVPEITITNTGNQKTFFNVRVRPQSGQSCVRLRDVTVRLEYRDNPA